MSIRLFLFLAIPFLLFSQNVNAQSDDELEFVGGLNALRVSVPFLMIAPDSRAASMGDVGAATSPDVNSQHWNPAKFAFIDNEWGVSFSYTPWLRNLINDMDLTYLTGYYRFDEQQVVSASLLYFSMGTIIFTDDRGTSLLDHNANEFALDLAYSRKFSDKIGGSIGFRYIRSDLTGGFSQQGQPAAKAGNSVAADISTYFQTPLTVDNKDAELAVGLNISNIGTKISYNDDPIKQFIPINMRLGTRFSIDIDSYNTMSIMVDGNKLLVPTPPRYDDPDDTNLITAGMDPDVPVITGMLQSFYDAPGGFQEELREVSVAAGIEYLYSGQFAVRAGYFDEHSTKGNRKYFTLGAGVKYNVFQLDFAYLIPRAGQANPLANTVRFTLAFEFEQSRPGRTRTR
ncbi:MAG: hypothetical protein CVT98_05225 [Bacteroidetes bacterium HGW-Bacteroidetes-15]|nr:MAG: hypothetical protein CVT98_05225 [Bacteroidetes bacterium HGW-Bacteroidetes-15]